MSLPLTAPAPRSDVKVEDVVAEKSNDSGVELRSAIGNTYEQLHVPDKSPFMVNYVLFQGLLEDLEQSGEYISKGMHTFICDPPYNTRRIAELSKSEYDRLSMQDMIHFLNLRFDLMHLGAHGSIFCSRLQFKIW